MLCPSQKMILQTIREVKKGKTPIFSFEGYNLLTSTLLT